MNEENKWDHNVEGHVDCVEVMLSEVGGAGASTSHLPPH